MLNITRKSASGPSAASAAGRVETRIWVATCRAARAAAAGDAAGTGGRPRAADLGGLQRSRRLHVYRVLFGYLYGHILTGLQEVVERPR